ncbi:serine hydrolase domain-containing protein [Bailinhaonella thermotolerans]|uniref:Class A beta-lactamase-related serine hydrolase n=1 Tax=Bailinhaonella thermotolerans TaxID=1070861 RepID=A0A3A4ABA0_9ACTN|nr:serine hydrolase domain-containing protein [Bailinhaonella thermotolerans]RJL22813.1 class A beta-lactamase-related serine hydrolase [Bailinhaonella thermotolerans]
MSDLQKRVQATIDQLVESGAEHGVQVAVYRDGEQVVDAVAGLADPATGREVTSGTPFYNFSIGKGATATVAHVLAERGLFGYDTPVAELWPEFARNGKQGVTVRHVLTHTAGVPGVPLDSTPEDMCDWDKQVANLEDAELWWEPGTQMGYHAYTFGYLVGEIVRRATGKPISQVLLEDVAGPLGVGDELYFGMPESEHHRLAVLEDAPMDMSAFGEMPDDLPMFKAGPMTLFPTAALGNRPDYLSADIPAGGKTTARAIARMYAALLGEVDGVRLITPERLREATAIAVSGPDAVFGYPSAWGLGYGVGLPNAGYEATPTWFGMGGAGGSGAFADTATGTVVAVTKNLLTQDFATFATIVDLVTGSGE